MNQSKCMYTQCQANLMNRLRMLWEQHVFWTRSFIISTASDLGDLDMVTKRLLINPKDFAEAWTPFYGRRIADTFQSLLTQHLLIAADLVNAAKKGNTQAADDARRRWYSNADQIASFFAGINPNWSESTWRTLLYSHLQMTEQEAILWLEGRYEQDIQMFDQIEEQALKMADYMFYGMAKQFRYC